MATQARVISTGAPKATLSTIGATNFGSYPAARVVGGTSYVTSTAASPAYTTVAQPVASTLIGSQTFMRPAVTIAAAPGVVTVASAVRPITTVTSAVQGAVQFRDLPEGRIIRAAAIYKGSPMPVSAPRVVAASKEVKVEAPKTGKLQLSYGATGKLNLAYGFSKVAASMFDDVPVAAPDAILSLATNYKEDKFAQKVNLGIGAYRTEQGKPWPLPSVLAAQMEVATDKSEDKEYVPIDGKPEHKRPVQQLIFSDGAIDSGTIATAQSLSGTGSLALIGQFLSNICGCKIIHVPKPTWGNHHAIFKRAGLSCKEYTYYKTSTRGFDFEGMIAAMKDMKAGEVILLHAVAQNPTGVDPTPEQWQVIVDTCRERKLTVLLDNAYQGYASGSLATDGLSMKLFEESGQEYFVAQSFAKNFGLYGERIGYIHVKCAEKEIAAAVLSQLKILIRQAYSSPPRHGAAIVFKLLSSPELKAQWLGELKFMSNRILQMRDALRSAIEGRGTPGTWNHITDQIGMFSYTGLTTSQVECMVKEKHIYMTKDGRISVAGLNPGNVDYVAACIDQVVRA